MGFLVNMNSEVLGLAALLLKQVYKTFSLNKDHDPFTATATLFFCTHFSCCKALTAQQQPGHELSINSTPQIWKQFHASLLPLLSTEWKGKQQWWITFCWALCTKSFKMLQYWISLLSLVTHTKLANFLY